MEIRKSENSKFSKWQETATVEYRFEKQCGKKGCWILKKNGYEKSYNSDLFNLHQAIKSFIGQLYREGKL